MVMKIKSEAPTQVRIMGECTDRSADAIVTFFNTPQVPTK